MPNDELTPARFGEAFMAFLDDMHRQTAVTGATLAGRVQQHLGTDVTSLPVTTEQFDPFDQPNVQVALDSYIADIDSAARLIGIGGEQKQYVTSVLSAILGHGGMSGMRGIGEGPVDYINFHLAEGQTLPCVQHGLFLLNDGTAPLAVAVLGPSSMHGPRQQVQVEVVSVDPARGSIFLRELRDRMRRLNVYRGHVLSLDPGRLDMGAQPLVAFHDLPNISRDDLVLPEAILKRIERHTIAFSEHADALKASGRSLKRGMLLHGIPGTGKTLTLMYLIGQMHDRTVLLTTGLGMGLLSPVMQMARALAPSIVVLEDVDLIAEERGNPFARGGGLLFELLNELDGLESDVDVIFALTTNRPDVLEPALAARPGRVDLAVEFPIPDLDARTRLLTLYAKGLTLVDVDLHDLASEIDGASPAYIKELLRRAAVIAADDSGTLVVTDQYIDLAREDLAGGGALGRKLLGFRHDGEQDTPSGFPGFPMTSPRFPEDFRGELNDRDA